MKGRKVWNHRLNTLLNPFAKQYVVGKVDFI